MTSPDRSLYEQDRATRRFQAYVDHFADPDPIPVDVTPRPVFHFLGPISVTTAPVSSDDQYAETVLEPAGMDRGS